MLVANPITYDGRVVRHAQTLAQAGHQVRVIGVLGPRDREDPLPVAADFQCERIERRPRGVVATARWLHSALRQRGAMWLWSRQPQWGLRSLDDAGLAALAVATSAPELALRAILRGAQVIHANDLSTLPAAAWAARVLGCPYLYDAHELYIDEHPDLSDAERRARARAEGHYIQQAAAVMTVNQLIADELQQLYGVAAPVVVRNLPRWCAVPPPDSRPLPTPGRLRLLYHGAHIGLEQHGTDDILRALARLRGLPGSVASDAASTKAVLSPAVDATLTMRGGLTPEAERALRARLLELGIADFVTLCPPVPGAEALVRAADADVGLAVHPPLCQSYRYTTSSKVYEYQAAGLAVCASDLVGNRLSVAADAGVFYPPSDDAQLATVLRQLALDPHRLRALQQAAYAHAQAELSWEHESERLLGIYRRLDATGA